MGKIEIPKCSGSLLLRLSCDRRKDVFGPTAFFEGEASYFGSAARNLLASA
jgi:hypothetical protein